MTQSYFLGVNSCKGFVSLYSGFPPDPEAFLHIIKGGPGTGKSNFMRRIGQEAEARGLDVEYILCSGDPDSLDGVYIPALKQAWVDGTAPHVVEPRHFGADSDYVNLGVYCRLPMTGKDCERVRQLSAQYKSLYGEAYEKLRQAKSLHDELESIYHPYMDFAALDSFTDHTVQKVFE